MIIEKIKEFICNYFNIFCDINTFSNISKKEIKKDNPSKNILSLTHSELKDFFLKNESYINLDLPPYFNFNLLLKELDKKIANKDLNSIKKLLPESQQNPKKNKRYDINSLENVNYKLLHNKNGKYDWRPYEIINPILYVFLVKTITKKDNWIQIQDRITDILTNSKIQCLSLPIVSETKNSDKAEQILNWWEQVEQNSLILSLDYNYIYHTDITDCYSSIYTHSIPWALHTKNVAKQNQTNSLVGNQIDTIIRNMRFGQTNGIPQGSVLMDFIAELVLLYADEELTKRISHIDEKDYKILRYRDDYRIFVNSTQIADEIIKNLTEVLIELGLKLHSSKTTHNTNVIQGSIKEDKIEWIQRNKLQKTLQKKLINIHSFGLKYPNSGTLVKELQSFLHLIKQKKSLKKYENINVLISIIVDIAYLNPKTYPISIAIISNLLNHTDDINTSQMIEKVLNKFKNIPNTNYLEIWLQRAIIKHTNIHIPFKEKICKLVNNESIEIWNNEWTIDELKDIINTIPIIDNQILNTMDKEINENEVKLFGVISS